MTLPVCSMPAQSRQTSLGQAAVEERKSAARLSLARPLGHPALLEHVARKLAVGEGVGKAQVSHAGGVDGSGCPEARGGGP